MCSDKVFPKPFNLSVIEFNLWFRYLDHNNNNKKIPSQRLHFFAEIKIVSQDVKLVWYDNY